MRLVLDFQVPDKYDKQVMTNIVRAICNQVNGLSEGDIAARYQAQTTVPNGAEAAQVSDIVWDSNATVRGSVAPGVAASYVRLGWICTVPGTPGTWQEMRVLTGA